MEDIKLNIIINEKQIEYLKNAGVELNRVFRNGQLPTNQLEQKLKDMGINVLKF